MKTVILVRHAKSSWDDATVSDFDRPLTGRGKKNAPDMARRLAEQNINFDVFISSPALRAKQTAQLFASEMGLPDDKIIYIPELYLAFKETFQQVIALAPSSANVIAVFSHNPGITDYVNSLTGVRIDNMPTASVFGVRINISNWSEYPDAKKEFLFFDFPKSRNRG